MYSFTMCMYKKSTNFNIKATPSQWKNMCTVEVQLNHETIYMYTYKESVTQYKLHYYSCCVARTHPL